ncbi:tetratricopeptide repeat protein [candidate division KSB1 bacterium]|nr:tetratricopeptide repeat protein [candidate division KSB1 bacterium]
MKLKAFHRNLFLVALSLIFSVQAHAQANMTAAKWQADLRYLQEVVNTERSNLFHKVTSAEFNRAVSELHVKIPQMQRHEIIVGLARLVAMFRIGHTVLPLQVWEHDPDPKIAFHRFPVLVYLFSDGVYVRSAKEQYREAVGGRVVRLGKLPIDQALEAVRPVVHYENEQGFKSEVPYFLGCPEVLHATGVIDDLKRAPLVIEKDGKEQTVWLQAEEGGLFPGMYGIVNLGEGWVDARQFANAPTPLWLKDLQRNYFYEYLPDSKTMYVRHSQVQNESDETIAAFFQRIFKFVDENEVEKFVLDLRLNSGGNNYLNRPIIVGLIQAGKINQSGRLFTIIGRRTFSAAQNLTNEIEKYTETVFVGEPTSENVNFYGDVVRKTLPNSGLRVFLSHLWWQNLDPRDTREWTSPQIAVDMTVDDYRNNRDPVMEAILHYTPQPSLTERLKALFIKGNAPEARKQAFSYRADPHNRFDNVEDKINRLGYDLMNESNLDAALEAFRLNVELYPNSANCYDSLAECYWKRGDLSAAIQHYEKAITLDTNGSVAANSEQMLKQIRAQAQSANKK